MTQDKLAGACPSLAAHRQHLEGYEPRSHGIRVPVQEMMIMNRQQVPLPIKMFTPTHRYLPAPFPTIFYIPGTAFIGESQKFSDMICSHLAASSGCQVIKLSHRLAPEAVFPQGIDDCFDLLSYVLKNCRQSLQIDTQKVCLMGYSSGGNFAASIALQAAQAGLPLQYQVLISPSLDLSRQHRAFKQFEDQDTRISDEFVDWFLDLYIKRMAKQYSHRLT